MGVMKDPSGYWNTVLKGGPGSGNFGHSGRPGEVGGSGGEGGGESQSQERKLRSDFDKSDAPKVWNRFADRTIAVGSKLGIGHGDLLDYIAENFHSLGVGEIPRSDSDIKQDLQMYFEDKYEFEPGKPAYTSEYGVEERFTYSGPKGALTALEKNYGFNREEIALHVAAPGHSSKIIVNKVDSDFADMKNRISITVQHSKIGSSNIEATTSINLHTNPIQGGQKNASIGGTMKGSATRDDGKFWSRHHKEVVDNFKRSGFKIYNDTPPYIPGNTKR